ncbi:hypothetical protein Q9189_006054 [Teloschistes chrysophthalmus]
MAAPSMQQNGTITYHNGTNILNARNNNPWSTEYGDHMIRVNVYPGNGCTEGPTTFDMAGNEGQECWNFEHGVSIQVSSANRIAEDQGFGSEIPFAEIPTRKSDR